MWSALDSSHARQCTDTSNSRRRCVENGGDMSRLLRGIAAGWGAKKLGGGCLSTIVVFIILWWLLGHFGIFR
jgi:hypothetical protein